MKSYQKILGKSLALIAKKRYTEKEMRSKLEKFVDRSRTLVEEDKDQIETVMERLKELSYIDDLQFAKDFTSVKFNYQNKGRLLVERDLKRKGIAKSDIKTALDHVNADETELAIKALEKKMDKWKEENIYSQKAKAYRFLASRGFRGDAVYRAVESCYDSRGL